ncbi:MAG: PhnD/SsuA/transferrin family substrate-binding protein [Lamprobacter sp.]|uniref:PhnD/SsuA/transferrin family substrate-binding protein n=1 Tax=Lamprobacter sp. TaxID=3100796 RepID=UPI002B261448|nr:PhnD/SsuA/transferrin family substrate-binding protein [Lamprobacter sp.]MEA3640713.1 PhnD/SsuA/transferrin family substrate-binding protein [Lamprobacter sp.]
MARFASVAAALCFTLSPSSGLATQPATQQALVYAPLPLENASLTQARNQPLVDLLARLLQRPLEMRLYPNHAALLDGITSGDVDLAELGPLPFLLARESLPGLQAVATFREADGRTDYRCVLVAPVDGLRALFQIAGREQPPTLALTRKESTCGPTASFWLLVEHGIDPAFVQAAYQGGHDEVALAVLRETFTLGGVKDSVARDFHGLGLRVLAASEPVPGFVLVANTERLDDEEREGLQAALLALTEGEGPLTTLQNGRHGFAAFERGPFERIEAMRALAADWLDQVLY